MKFGPVATAGATGAILAHSVKAGERTLRKGTRLGAADVARLAAAGVAEVIVATLDIDDVHEDAAAGRLAEAVAGDGVRVEEAFTGRSNLYAEAAGVLVVDSEAVDAFNRIDPGITLATLPRFAAVEAGRMVATVKIIPFAVPEGAVAAAMAVLADRPPVRVAPFRPARVGVVSTLLPSLKSSVVDKTLKVLAERLAPAGATIAADERVPHDAEAVAAALRRLAADGADMLVVFGASAVVDRGDVIPAGIEAAGGEVHHFGMPVDPGNLLLVGALGDVPVVGAPGCARSPKENGFDWVLQRLLAGLAVTADDITGLGVGGLLMEIVSRPQPRAGPVPDEVAPARSIGAVVLAAGRGSRMGGPVKQLATIAGVPLVRRAAEAAVASRAAPVVVVTGHAAADVAAALAGLAVTVVHNPDFAEGLSTSLRTGLSALPEDVEAAVVVLADMPGIDAPAIDRVIAGYDPAAGALVVMATAGGKRGNPVLWSRRFFPELSAITGDTGGRQIIAQVPEAVVEVELGEAAAIDVDTPEALAAAGGLLGQSG
jgi:molybdenum cofactor cytidylyltransferase